MRYSKKKYMDLSSNYVESSCHFIFMLVAMGNSCRSEDTIDKHRKAVNIHKVMAIDDERKKYFTK